MSKKNRPLPKPPSTPFGRKKAFEDDDAKGPLMADQMAMAMSAGKLDEFLEKELPDNEHARKLAEMMMGMTGMMPGGFAGGPASEKGKKSKKSGPVNKEDQSLAEQPPEDVVNAVQSGDVQSLMDILKREHRKRQGKEAEDVEEKMDQPAAPADQAVIEKEIIEELITIAANNNLTLDWIFFRALKRYVQEYKKTGNL